MFVKKIKAGYFKTITSTNWELDFKKYIQESLLGTLTFRKLCSFVNSASIHLCINELS